MFQKILLIVMFAGLIVSCNGNPTLTPTLIPTQPSTATSTPIPTSTSTIEPTATPTVQPTPEVLPQVVFGPDNFPADINPLTGLAVTETLILDRRPVSVKVNIVPRTYARPPWGLSLADIVYDYYHNDGYSRFHAIFYGNEAPLIGPIRSGRLPDAELVRMYHSIFAYGSADQRINSRFFNSDFNNRLVLESGTSDCPPNNEKPLCRYDPSGYNHLLGGTSEIRSYATTQGSDNTRQNLNGMSFDSEAPAGETPGQEVITRYSSDDFSKWQYDQSSGRYLRFQDKALIEFGKDEEYEPLLDALTQEQIAADNVIVILVPHSYFVPPPGEIVEILLSGTGTAYAFRDGKVYEVTWNRPTVDSVLYLTFPDGTNYPFKPGTTWIQVVTPETTISQPEDGIWRFDFLIY